jgi:lipopolysaccharide cholinephosphotransferase
MMHVGMPIVQVYHVATGNLILNSSSSDAEGLEKVADMILAPAQYVMAGKYFETTDGIHYTHRQRFDYQDSLSWAKTGFSFLAMPVSIALGGTIKAIALLQEGPKLHHEKLAFSYLEGPQSNLNQYYEKTGIQLVSIEQAEALEAPKFERRPGDERTMEKDKEALKEVVQLFHQNNIPYWLDCGTLLGAQRYGGIIPWDFDLDIAILQNDFDNAYRVLSKLDTKKYAIQDWSSRDRPKSYLKVYIKETGTLIDIYHFEIDEKSRVIRSVLSNENSIFLPESWKIRERRFIIDTPIDYVFPLKRANFDGIEAFVPNQTVNYLKQRYGQNIGPAKVFNALTNRYEKDLSHPYWQMPHAH